MSDQRSFDRRFTESMDAERAGARLPSSFYDEFRQRAHHSRQRPRWLALIKEPPMRTDSRLAVGSPTVRVAAILAATFLLAVALAGIGIAGQRLLAADGAIVVAADGNGDFTTITEAVDAAEDGQEIVIRPGTYPESLVIDKDLAIRGDSDDPSDIVIAIPEGAPLLPEELAARCMLGCSDPTITHATGVYLSETDTTMSDLTVVGRAGSSAVTIHGGAPVLERVVIEVDGPFEPSWSEWRNGLTIDHASEARLLDITHERGWIGIDRGSSPIFEGSRLLETCVEVWGEATTATFRLNTVTGCSSGWAFEITHGATPLIEDNEISDGGLYVWRGRADDTHAVIGRNRIFTSDSADAGPGIEVNSGGSATIEDNEIFGNDYGITVDAGDAEFAPYADITGNRIYDNSTGMYVETGSTSVIGNEITQNRTGLLLGPTATDGMALADNMICGNETNVRQWGGEALDTTGNEVCEDAPNG